MWLLPEGLHRQIAGDLMHMFGRDTVGGAYGDDDDQRLAVLVRPVQMRRIGSAPSMPSMRTSINSIDKAEPIEPVRGSSRTPSRPRTRRQRSFLARANDFQLLVAALTRAAGERLKAVLDGERDAHFTAQTRGTAVRMSSDAV